MKPRLDLLTLLADHLENYVDPKTFNMWHWRQEKSCGTAGCAIGHAYSIPQIRDAGLTFRLKDSDGYTVPFCGHLIGFAAVAEVFGITSSEATYLFSPSYYRPDESEVGEETLIPVAEVAARIRQFIKEKQADGSASVP